MHFKTPDPGIGFEIPDAWWAFVEPERFAGSEMGFYPPSEPVFEIVDLSEIEPPTRALGVPLFRKYKLVPVLLAFQSPECQLPLVQVLHKAEPGRYRYTVHNGLHRFYASIAAGYGRLPVRILSSDQLVA